MLQRLEGLLNEFAEMGLTEIKTKDNECVFLDKNNGKIVAKMGKDGKIELVANSTVSNFTGKRFYTYDKVCNRQSENAVLYKLEKQIMTFYDNGLNVVFISGLNDRNDDDNFGDFKSSNYSVVSFLNRPLTFIIKNEDANRFKEMFKFEHNNFYYNSEKLSYEIQTESGLKKLVFNNEDEILLKL